MTLYMAVTADKYELPIVVEDSQKELAISLGRRTASVREELCRNRKGKPDISGRRRGFLLKEVEVENDE